jgi:dihydropteroate synthase
VIPCSGYSPPAPRTFSGATAKAVAVAVLEAEGGPAAGADGKACVSRLEHAAYLGRELQRAEEALRHGTAYVQD